MQTLNIGMPIDPQMTRLIRHMHAIGDYRQVFDRLQGSWDTLTLLGQLSGNATEMAGTRAAFERLTGDLLNHLATETRDKAIADLRIKSQDMIDILVRNLFERTADIGFLAADTDIREILEEQAPTDASRLSIEARFRDYVAKYSVYSDIVLVGLDGAIRARLTPHLAQTARHPVIDEALVSPGAYVEHHGVLDFISNAEQLVYAWRVEGAGKQPLGVLILVFRLADEMAGIFGNLIGENDWTILGCVTPGGTVVAASCPVQIPVGLRLAAGALASGDPVIRLGGRQYLAVCCRPSDYQGYAGPGWLGLGLLPLEAAFDSAADDARTRIDGDVLATVTSQSGLFSEELRTVSREAGVIQQDLSRSVWNGSVRQGGSTEVNAAFSKILLREISKAGAKTQAVFEASIGDLHRTVIDALVEKCRSRAAFAIDVMDRNLYERANDCRWWALNASFARVLAAPSPEGARLCTGILETINGLYTVYTNLILFDAAGIVFAVSNPSQAHLVGSPVDGEWVERTLALRSGQGYAVSEFVPTPLYDGEPTYVYTAAVQRSDGGRPLGGIAIVFDATPQFSAILSDCLPVDETSSVLAGAFSLLVDKKGRLIASSDERYPVGSASPIPVDVAALESGGDNARIMVLDGCYAAVGASLSRGYREYKTSDGHAEPVVALCAVPLGTVGTGITAQPAGVVDEAILRRAVDPSDAFEIATFHIGRHWLGVQARDVVEAVDLVGLKPSATQQGDGLFAGYKLHQNAPVPVLRLERLLGIAGPVGQDRQIVIVCAAGRLLGLLVDRLGEIAEIGRSELQPLRDIAAGSEVPALGLVATRDAQGRPASTLMLLDTDRLGASVEGETKIVPLRAAE